MKTIVFSLLSAVITAAKKNVLSLHYNGTRMDSLTLETQLSVSILSKLLCLARSPSFITILDLFHSQFLVLTMMEEEVEALSQMLTMIIFV